MFTVFDVGMKNTCTTVIKSYVVIFIGHVTLCRFMSIRFYNLSSIFTFPLLLMICRDRKRWDIYVWKNNFTYVDLTLSDFSARQTALQNWLPSKLINHWWKFGIYCFMLFLAQRALLLRYIHLSMLVIVFMCISGCTSFLTLLRY